MTGVKNLIKVLLLLAGLLPTGVNCEKTTVFVYGRLGGVAVLPCTTLATPDCSLVSWTFFKGTRFTTEIHRGKVSEASDKSSRMSITPNCSLSLRDLGVDDAASYVCLDDRNVTLTNVYLSLLTVTSLTTITDLQPGGKLVLSCILFTYYDAGSCKSYSTTFDLSWEADNGTVLHTDSRYELINRSRCNITLVTNLQRTDNNRKWRCQVNTRESSRAAFLDFTSSFLFEDQPPPSTRLGPASCPVHLPISRIALCVALPLMVITVGFFSRRREGRRDKTSAAGIELREVN